MAVNTLPLSFGKVESTTAAITVAKTAETDIASPADATDLRLLFTAGTNGGGIYTIEYQVISTSGTPTQAASKIMIWETKADGTAARIVRQVPVAVGSAINTTANGQNGIITFNRADYPSGVLVFVSVSVVTANCQWNFTCRGGQFEAQ
jgi:hypothetical protein